MAKEVKSTIQLTDKFLIHRENTDAGEVMKTVDGSDVQAFIEDSQSKFTDEIEQVLASLKVSVDSNSDTIGENQRENESSHKEFEADIESNKNYAGQNGAEIATTKKRTTKLESDDRTFGYYTLKWMGETPSSLDPEPGCFITLDENGNLERSDYAKVAIVRFNRTDILQVTRSFLSLFSGDVMELVFITNAGQDFIKHQIESRVTFRVTDDYDPAGQYPPDPNPEPEFIDVNVELINGIGQNTSYEAPNGQIYVGFPFKTDVTLYDEVDGIDEYVKCGVYPSVNVEEAVDLNTLKRSLSPIGTIIMWPSPTIPEGWLLCDGRSLSQATQGMSEEDTKDIQELFANLGFSQLPPIAGRFVAGAKGSYYNEKTHSFTLGTSYNRQTGLPTSNNGATQNLTVSNAGAHNHTANMTSNGRHSHKYGSSNNHASGNNNNVYDARNRHGSYQTDTAGDHNHTATISENGSHKHNVTGFNSDNRPHTIALHYIIKYKHVIDD